MRWRTVNDYHAVSDDGRFIISRTNHGAAGSAYQAVRLGVAWRNGKGFDGSTSLHVELGVDASSESARRAAVGRCQAACEAVAHE